MTGKRGTICGILLLAFATNLLSAQGRPLAGRTPETGAPESGPSDSDAREANERGDTIAELGPGIDELLELIEAQTAYRSSVTDRSIQEAMLRGIVASLGDPFAVVLDTVQYSHGPEGSLVTEDSQRSPRRGETGIIPGQDQFQRLTVRTVLPGSPAEQAGIYPGDRLLRIDDTNLAGFTPWEAIPLLTGKPGSAAMITFERGGTGPREQAVTFGEHDPETVKVRIGEVRDGDWQDTPGGGIAWLRVYAFLGDSTIAQWSEAVERIVSTPTVQRIVYDFRDNAGGDNSTITILGDLFRTGDTIVRFESLLRNNQRSEVVRNYDRPRSRLMSYPAVALVNGGTASLAEIAAVSLRENRSVPIVGLKTFGKGTTQTWVKTRSGFAVHLTLGRWLTPEGRSVNKQGLSPDLLVRDHPWTARDEQLLAAVELLTAQ